MPLLQGKAIVLRHLFFSMPSASQLHTNLQPRFQNLLIFRLLICPDFVQATMVDGFYAGDSTLTGDLATVAYRIQLLGFNAIRLPFSFLVPFQQEPALIV